MSNEEIYKSFQLEHNANELLIFSKMMSKYWQMIYEDEKKRSVKPPLESEYEKRWWKAKYYELLTNERDQ